MVESYDIYRDGTYLTSVTGPSVSDVGLNEGTRYCYTIYAYDTAGNESALSEQACAITWSITLIDDSSAYASWDRSIAVDSADNVHICYAKDRGIKHAKKSSGVWVVENVVSQSLGEVGC
jgi:chitodextrinase